MEWREGDSEVARSDPVSTVLDSSVLVKWFSQEEKTEEALALRNEHIEGTRELWVVNLSFYEVSNALRYKSGFTSRKLSESLNSLFKLHLNVEPEAAPLLAEASTIAYKCGVTIYDAVPVALAENKRTRCLTADRETQYAKIKPKGYPIDLL